ncbi:MAG: DUF2911 domain-containing protein [Acidobacteria bacterium]|nr:MAG: DUF2911 domain-containing protein [Acidobacteriota bacterium]
MRTTALLSLVVMAATLSLASAQQQRLSPPAETSVTIDGKVISIKYSAPSMRGRKIFGELVPNGKVWRAGANAATALHTDADLDIGGVAVPKGDYTLYVWPEQDQLTLIVNKQTGQWGTNYDQAQDLGRAKMTMSKSPTPVETFKITLSEKGAKAAELQLAWENTIATVPITVK